MLVVLIMLSLCFHKNTYSRGILITLIMLIPLGTLAPPLDLKQGKRINIINMSLVFSRFSKTKLKQGKC